MSDVALRMAGVYKKFSRGEKHDSLRDLIPAMARGVLHRVAKPLELKQQEFWALRDVSFEIRKGEAVGIIGHNGAGKSTMLKHLSGIMRPTTGRIEVKGRLSALIEVGAGFHPDLTGRENVFLNGVILGMSRAEIRRKFDEIVDFAGLADFIDTPVKRYSSGMFTRLGFSVAAHMEPDVLIIDEVLSVGDYAFQSRGIAKMRSIVSSGATVVFVSHNLGAVADLCSRCLLMGHGQLAQDGPTSNVIQSYMKQISAVRTPSADKDATIESVGIRGEDGPRLGFDAGERLWVDVRIRARKRTERMACYLYIKDKQYYTIFSISVERLGMPLLTLDPGETFTYSFELKLHLADGTFHVCVSLLLQDTSHVLDIIEPVASILLTAPGEVVGSANLYPTVQQLVEAPGEVATA